MKRWVVIAVSLGALAARAGPLERGRQCADLFYASDIDTLWGDLSVQAQRSFNGKQGLRAFRRKVEAEFGVEQRVIHEATKARPGATYTRTATFSRYGGAIEMVWTFDEREQAASVAVHPSWSEAPTHYDEYRTKTRLRLPFSGVWNVLWGGHSVADNRHAVSADMRFAYDFFVLRGDKSYEGDGSRREQYFCWNRPLVAPGDGLVVEVANDIPDNAPGAVNPDRLYGNHVLIDHGNGEVSLLAHIQRGSITVQRGQPVRGGDVLGRCGNSGNSTEPHLHYQLMTGRRYLKAFGLPAQFQNYMADGVFISRGEPKRGQVLEPAYGPMPVGSRN
jgi:hypothetical protein